MFRTAGLTTWVRWIFGILVVFVFLFLSVSSGEPPVLPGVLVGGFVVLGLWVARNRIPAFVRPRTPWRYFIVFWFVLFGTAFVVDYTVNLPVAQAQQGRLFAEFASIPPPSGIPEIGRNVITKPTTVLVDATYAGALSWADVHTHYDRLLAAERWRYEEDIAYSALGRVACYSKNDDRARVWSPGPGAGYLYSFGVEWELRGRPRCF